MRLRILASIAGLCAAPCLTAQAQPVTQSYPVVQGSAYKFEQIADGVVEARILGGIHWRTSSERGRIVGEDIGQYAVHHYLRRKDPR